MKTKVTILGQEPESKKLKPIEFIYHINTETGNLETPSRPSSWENIKLISKKTEGLDIMIAWDDGDSSKHCLFLGRFNDGIVE